jgi:hypothetical protein
MSQDHDDVGPDGWPTDPNHPANKPSERVAPAVRRLRVCENAWRAGNLPAVVDAISICEEFKCPPPPWLVGAVAALAARQMLVKSGPGRFNSPQAVFDKNQKHYIRWDAVKELLDRGHELYENWKDTRGLKEESAFLAAVEYLKDTPAKGGKKTVERSYRLVEKNIAEGNGALFYNPRFMPNGKRA